MLDNVQAASLQLSLSLEMGLSDAAMRNEQDSYGILVQCVLNPELHSARPLDMLNVTFYRLSSTRLVGRSIARQILLFWLHSERIKSAK